MEEGWIDGTGGFSEPRLGYGLYVERTEEVGGVPDEWSGEIGGLGVCFATGCGEGLGKFGEFVHGEGVCGRPVGEGIVFMVDYWLVESVLEGV